MTSYKHSELTKAIINAFFHVYNALGYGFLEKVYRNALIHELKKRGYEVEHEVRIKIYYDGTFVGEYIADIIVNGIVILELKSASAIAPEHEAQLLNYLRAANIEVGLILNFGPKPEMKRKVFDNWRKTNQEKH
jgi:GxxExxY protein